MHYAVYNIRFLFYYSIIPLNSLFKAGNRLELYKPRLRIDQNSK